MFNEISGQIEWARVAPDKVVVATADRVWLYQPSSGNSSDLFAQPMTSEGSVATTQKLLDTSIILAKRAVSSSRPPAFSLMLWIWRLAGQYHITHSTPRLMEEAAQRFAAAGRKTLAQWAA
ncbi:MAG: hypothetical protein C4322_15600, partial [Mastigocladus sp. ERB_26_1]